MHIKDYPTHPEEYRLKRISDERLEKSIEDRQENLQLIYEIYSKATQNNTNKRFQYIKENQAYSPRFMD